MDDETINVICQAYNLPGVHPAAELFPLIEGREFDELCHSIGTHGLEQDIILTHDGYLLDGRNRLRACYRTGALERFKKLDAIYANDYVGYVVRLNLNRRHLNESQRAVIAARLANMTRGGDKPSIKDSNFESANWRIRNEPQISQSQAAEMLNVSERSVQRAVAIERQAPELIEKIERGKITVTAAMHIVKEQEREQRREDNRKKIERVPEPEKVVQVIDAKYATIVIDPPWDWGDEGDQDQFGRARPDYSTMSISQLEQLNVQELADVDCHLYLWITNRSLPKGFRLLECWGFRYITTLTWVKPSFGMGNYFRGQTEHVLFGVKGSQLLKRKDVGTVFHANRGPGGHSSKPVGFLELVESCSPGPYLEMFARSHRKGWVIWGENS